MMHTRLVRVSMFYRRSRRDVADWPVIVVDSHYRNVAEIFALQKQVYLGELGPVRVAALPALGHDLVHFPRAAGRRFHVPVFAVGQVHVVGVLDHLFVGELRQRLMAAEH